MCTGFPCSSVCYHYQHICRQKFLEDALGPVSISDKAICSSSNFIYFFSFTQCDAFYVGETKNSLSTRMNGHWFSFNKSNNLPLPVTTHQISPTPFNLFWNLLHNLRLTLIKSPTIILNLPINSLYPPDIALVSTSDNSLPLFALLPPPHPLSCFLPWWLFFKTLMWHHLYCEFTYVHTLLIDKDLCEHPNISINFPCSLLYMSFIQRTLRLIKAIHIYSYFGVILFCHVCVKIYIIYCFLMISLWYYSKVSPLP